MVFEHLGRDVRLQGVVPNFYECVVLTSTQMEGPKNRCAIAQLVQLCALNINRRRANNAQGNTTVDTTVSRFVPGAIQVAAIVPI